MLLKTSIKVPNTNQRLSDRPDNLIIPYSNGHLNDFEGSDGREEKFKLISKLTNNYCIIQEQGKENIEYRIVDPSQLYDHNKKSITKFDIELMEPVLALYKKEPHNININELYKYYPEDFIKTFFPNTIKSDSMYDLLKDILSLDFERRPEAYEMLRKVGMKYLGFVTNFSNLQNY